MPCGKRPLVRRWDKPKSLRVITPSRYEQNEASVKVHWRNVVKVLEDSYKDDSFWETQINTVRELVGPTIFQRIAKIYDLPLEATKYVPKREPSFIVPSEQFYQARTVGTDLRPDFSMSDFEPSRLESSSVEEESESQWSESSIASPRQSAERKRSSKMRQLSSKSLSKSLSMSKTLTKLLSKSFSKFISRTLSRTIFPKQKGWKSEHSFSMVESLAASDDDLVVHRGGSMRRHFHSKQNPHFQMLYCNESETDMIKWESKYKQKAFEVSASDEFSKRAEILTKKIAKEFYDWWVSLGNVEFKSEIKRPEDIETLFQVWFDEHSSRGLVLNPKTLPCVLQTIADYTNVKKASCPNALKRQLAYDIKAETSPPHTMAFGASLPHKMKHIPPRNNTNNLWHCVKIPEDLKTMACVWDDIKHLTSTKAFQSWLQNHPQLPMPPCLQPVVKEEKKRQAFTLPSSIYMTQKGQAPPPQELSLPISQFTLELKQVLSKLMNE